MKKTTEVLETLTEMVRVYWDNVLGGEYFEPSSLAVELETELIRAEDHLLELKKEERDEHLQS